MRKRVEKGGRKTRVIKVEQLARVEGEGGLTLRTTGGKLDEVELRIFEPPRFFEGLLVGRGFAEAPDITSRICGICPIAYQMSACHAMESACGVTVSPQVRALRRLIYCGEWIESHMLHVYMLHAPDFLGFDGAIEMAKKHPAHVERGLRLKKAGNEILRVMGGREIHPVNVKLGGFYRAPERKELRPLKEILVKGRDEALETVRWVAAFPFPDEELPNELVSLRHPDEYPMNEGRIASTDGLDIPVPEFGNHFRETQVAHSTALHCLHEGRPYIVGPMARFALNFGKLTPLARQAAAEAGIGPDCRNPFKNIIIRSIEVLHAFDEAASIIDAYERPDADAAEVVPKDAVGHGCTGAPRGILYHRYEIDADGNIVSASIVPPTSQNQPSIEQDIKRALSGRMHLARGEIKSMAERIVRNFDPCISCAAHFLDMRVVDSEERK